MDDALNETDVDGVRCFWVDTGRPTLASLLMFRFGSADEPVVESGWQHLLEHLALEGRGGGALTVNGEVSLLHTSFQVHGPRDGVAQILTEVSAWLSDPDVSRAEREARVLRAEANLRGTSAAASALSMRYGAAGPGLSGYGEVGLGRPTAQDLAERAARVFTRENAVLVLDGPPPAGLRFLLSRGEPLPFVPAVPCEDNLPAVYVSENGLVVSGVVRRSSDMSLGHELLREAMTKLFRTRDGSAYAPWVTYQPVDADNAVIIGGTDIRHDAVGPVADQALLVVRQLGRKLADPETFGRIKAARIQAITDPYALVGVAVRAAHEVLRGGLPLTRDQMVDEVRAADLVTIQEQWQAFHDTLLLGAPAGASWNRQLPMLNFPTTRPVRSGRTYRALNWPADRTRLSIDDQAIEVSTRDEARLIRLDRVAALLVYDDESRRVLRDDGFSLFIDPRRWRSGSSATARLDAVVGEPLRLPQHGPGASGHVGRWGLPRRWGTAMLEPFRPVGRLDRYQFGAALIAIMGVGLAIAMLAHGVGGGAVVIFAVAALGRVLFDASRRQVRRQRGRRR